MGCSRIWKPEDGVCEISLQKGGVFPVCVVGSRVFVPIGGSCDGGRREDGAGASRQDAGQSGQVRELCVHDRVCVSIASRPENTVGKAGSL